VKFNFGAKPLPSGKGATVEAYNGVTTGNGHLTGKKEIKEEPVIAA